jgi:hypothetical protein
MISYKSWVQYEYKVMKSLVRNEFTSSQYVNSLQLPLKQSILTLKLLSNSEISMNWRIHSKNIIKFVNLLMKRIKPLDRYLLFTAQ